MGRRLTGNRGMLLGALLLGALLALGQAAPARARAKFFLHGGETKVIKLQPNKPVTVRATNQRPVESYFNFRIWGVEDGKPRLIFKSSSITLHAGATRTRKANPEYREISITCEDGFVSVVVHQDNY